MSERLRCAETDLAAHAGTTRSARACASDDGRGRRTMTPQTKALRSPDSKKRVADCVARRDAPCDKRQTRAGVPSGGERNRTGQLFAGKNRWREHKKISGSDCRRNRRLGNHAALITTAEVRHSVRRSVHQHRQTGVSERADRARGVHHAGGWRKAESERVRRPHGKRREDQHQDEQCPGEHRKQSSASSKGKSTPAAQETQQAVPAPPPESIAHNARGVAAAERFRTGQPVHDRWGGALASLMGCRAQQTPVADVSPKRERLEEQRSLWIRIIDK